MKYKNFSRNIKISGAAEQRNCRRARNVYLFCKNSNAKWEFVIFISSSVQDNIIICINKKENDKPREVSDVEEYAIESTEHFCRSDVLMETKDEIISRFALIKVSSS